MARIALLLSGLPRQWSHCVHTQLGLFRQHESDVFFHFWDTIDAGEKRELLAAYQPKAHVFEPQIDFRAWENVITKTDNINSPSRMMSMYYGWKRVGAIFDQYCRDNNVAYDFAVRLRADLMFFGPLDNFLPQLQANDLLLSNHNDFNIVNDMFALGRIKPILYYLSMHDRVMIYKDRVSFNPELLLDCHLKSNEQGIMLKTATIMMLVFRPHMIGMPIEECLKEHPGASKWKDPEIVDSHKDFHGRKRGEQGLQHVEHFKNANLRQLEGQKSPPKPEKPLP